MFKLWTDINYFMRESNKDSFRIRIAPDSRTNLWFSFQGGMLILHITYDILKSN
jgi:hypothetical protein